MMYETITKIRNDFSYTEMVKGNSTAQIDKSSYNSVVSQPMQNIDSNYILHDNIVNLSVVREINNQVKQYKFCNKSNLLEYLTLRPALARILKIVYLDVETMFGAYMSSLSIELIDDFGEQKLLIRIDSDKELSDEVLATYDDFTIYNWTKICDVYESDVVWSII